MPKRVAKAKAIPKKNGKQVEVTDVLNNQGELGLPIVKFVEYYWQFNEAKKAAIAAGIAPAYAQQWATTTLALPAVQLMLSRRRNELMGDTDWQTKDSVRELMNIAMVDAVSVANSIQVAMNSIKPKLMASGELVFEPGAITLDDIPPEVRRCVKKIKQGVAGLGEDRMVFIESIEFYSRLDAIEKLNKHLGFYEKDNEQKVDAVALLIAALQKKNEGGSLVVAQ